MTENNFTRAYIAVPGQALFYCSFRVLISSLSQIWWTSRTNSVVESVSGAHKSVIVFYCVMLCYTVLLCYVILHMLCYIMLHYITLCYITIPLCYIIGRAKRAPHWGVQSRFRVIYIYIYVHVSVVCQINCVGGIT